MWLMTSINAVASDDSFFSSYWKRFPWRDLWRGVVFWSFIFAIRYVWNLYRQKKRVASSDKAHPTLEEMVYNQETITKLGGRTDKYEWNQNEAEVEISIPVETHVKKMHVVVSFTPSSLKVQVEGINVIDGALCRHIVPSESTWLFDEQNGQRVLLVSLFKKHQTTANQHWDCVCQGDKKINLSKLGPKIEIFDPTIKCPEDFVSTLRQRK